MFLGIFRKSPEQIAQEAEVKRVSAGVLLVRHRELLDRAKALTLDPTTLLFLIQLFGPLAVALIERLLARLQART